MARARAEYDIQAKDRTAKAFNSVQSRFKKTQGFAKGLGTQLIGLAGVGGFGALIKGSLDAGDEIQKLNLQLGASTEFLSEMRRVTNRSGVEFKTFTTSLRNMSRVIVEARDGTKTYTDVFDKLGISINSLDALNPEEQFFTIGKALQQIEDPTLRGALAMDIFGGRAQEVLRIFAQGEDAIAGMREEARKAGQSLSIDMVNDMAAANDAMADLKDVFSGLGLQLAGKFAPDIITVAKTLQTWLIPTLQFVGEVIGRIGKFIGGFAAAVGVFIRTLNPLKASLSFFQTVKDVFATPFEGTPKAPPKPPAPPPDPTGLSQQRLSGAFGSNPERRTPKVGKQEVQDLEVKVILQNIQRILETRDTVATVG